jgi:ABC-type multidrug transport system ATPase subunit
MKGFQDPEICTTGIGHKSSSFLSVPMPSPTDTLKLIWQDVSYSASRGGPLSWVKSAPEKKILNNLSGHLSSGSMTALMGPSGSGKTTLLNCISGKIKSSGLKGSVFLRFPDRRFSGIMQNIRIGFVPQQEHMFMEFTVRETIMFASRLINHSSSSMSSESGIKRRVEETIASLDMTACADSKLSLVSGGQLKRTSIALELISLPQILMLDEPTTGLDSDNAESLISLLKKISDGIFAPAIVATIHQPSTDTFLMFDQIYLLSKHGSNIYFGPPAQVISHFVSFGFDHRENVNPAEYMIEIANEKYGNSKMQAMTVATSTKANYHRVMPVIRKDVPIATLEVKINNSASYQFCMLFQRIMSADIIKSKVIFIRIILGILHAAGLSLLSKAPIGQTSGCWSDLMRTPGSSSGNMTEEESIRQMLSSSGFADLDMRGESDKASQVTIYFFILVMFHQFMTVISVVNHYPVRMASCMRELSNSWYNVTAYAASLILSEAVTSFVCILPSIAAGYYLSEFPDDWNRFLLVFGATYFLGLLWGARGLLTTIIFAPNTMIPMVLTIALMLQAVSTSGYMVMIQTFKPFFQKFAYFSDMRHGFNIMMTAVFGGGRCGHDGQTTEFVVGHVLKETSVIRLVSAWTNLNITYPSDLERLSVFLGLHPHYLDPVMENANSMFGLNDDIEFDVKQEEFQPSYILDHLKIQESDVIPGFAFLATMILITWIAVFVTLVFKSKKIRL